MNDKDHFIQSLRGVQYIVINTCYGGFGLSTKAHNRYKELVGLGESDDIWDRDISRDDPYLVQVVRELGEDANGTYSTLKIVEVPQEVSWHVDEYDGSEWIAENHRTWS